MSPDPRSPVVAVQLWVDAGTRCEGEGEHGSAHFLEHMLFRPPAQGLDLQRRVEELGGDVNAFTSHDETVVYACAPAGGAQALLEGVLERALEPHLSGLALEHERGVVLEEIAQSGDEPHGAAMDRLMGMLFGDSYGRPILGRRGDVRHLSVDDLKAFHRRTYAGGNLCLVLTGNVDPAQAVAWSKPWLSRRRRPAGVRESSGPGPAKPRVRVAPGAVAEASVRIGLRGPSLRELDDVVALELTCHALGEGEGSRLFGRLCRSEARCTDIFASYMAMQEAGTLLIGASCSVESAVELTESVLEELALMKRLGLSVDELERMRTAGQIAQVYRRETAEGLAHALGSAASTCGDPHYSRRYFERLLTIEMAEVRDRFRRVIESAVPCMSVVVPDEVEPDRRRELQRRLRGVLGRRSIKARTGKTRRRAGAHITELDSGARIVVVPDERVALAAGWLMWEGGQRREPARHAGLSHLSARVVAEGHHRCEPQDLARSVETMAGALDGFSGRNSAGINFEAARDHFPTLLDHALRCALHPTFDQERFEHERRVLREELQSEQQDPGQLALRTARAKLYGRHALARSLRGTPESWERHTVEAARKLWGHLGAAGCTLAVVGDVEPQAIVEHAASMLAGSPGRPWTADPKPAVPRKRSLHVRLQRPREQSSIALLVPTDALGHARSAPLDVLVALLGGPSGVLFDRLRERAGLVYSVGANVIEGLDGGYLQIRASCNPRNLERTLEVMHQALDGFAAELDADALRLAKTAIVGQHRLAMQRRSFVASLIAFEHTYGLSPGSLTDRGGGIAKVSKKAVASLAEDLAARVRVSCVVEPG